MEERSSVDQRRRLLPAFRSAIATACFRGFPALISRRMLLEITLRLRPFFSGIPTTTFQGQDRIGQLFTEGKPGHADTWTGPDFELVQ
jgi:hypothetical protein